jgi:glutamate N-acetyltransferase/amino-acid N-acetyltransferase
MNDLKDIVPIGFNFLGKHVGIKKDGIKDLGIVVSEKKCSAAAMFTKNSICGVSIPIGRKNVENGMLQAIVVTSGIANVATGKIGTENTNTIINAVAQEFDILAEDVLPSSTGVIGPQLPVDKVINGIQNSKKQLNGEWEEFAHAIMTTDKHVKMVSGSVGNAKILGICKGSGMIQPNMATMLVYFFTDADIKSNILKEILQKAVNSSFNMISVDTDTSTSDTVAILANGMAGEVDIKEFQDTFTKLCIELAKKVVIDGEGATRLIEANITSAKSYEQAKKVAKSIINSPLVKTAVYGADPNWGRIIMAVGKVFDSSITADSVTISFGEGIVYDRGTINDDVIEKLTEYLKKSANCVIGVDLHLGDEHATAWGCDLTEEYVDINASYTS